MFVQWKIFSPWGVATINILCSCISAGLLAIIRVLPSRRPTLLSIASHSEVRKARSEGPISSWMRRLRTSKYSSENGIGAAARRFSLELRYGWTLAPPTTSCRGRGLLAKLNSAKFLSQYKTLAFGEIFLPRNFCRIRYLSAAFPTASFQHPRGPKLMLKFLVLTAQCFVWRLVSWMLVSHTLLTRKIHPPWRICHYAIIPLCTCATRDVTLCGYTALGTPLKGPHPEGLSWVVCVVYCFDCLVCCGFVKWCFYSEFPVEW